MLLGDIIRSFIYSRYIDKEILGSRYVVQVDNIRPYSKNIETFGKYTQGDINSYSYIFYDRYQDTVIGLNLEKYIIV